MLSLCGCSSRRRGKKASSVSSDDVAPKVTAGKGPPETINHSAIIPPGPSRLSLDDFGVQTLELPKRKSSNALEAVKAKLIRHWSYNKDQPQKSRASPDGDKDEIARRAELRRFRARRIQEELNQDHSKCVSTHTSIRSTRYLSPLIDIGRPGRGPRDTIEFSIDSSNPLTAPYPSPAPTLSSFRTNFPASSMKRWSSCPASIGEQSGQVCSPLYNNSGASLSRKRCTTPGKITESKSLPNLLQPNMRAPQLARTKTTGRANGRHGNFSVWLALQESRSRDSSTSGSAESRIQLRRQATPAPQRLTDSSHDTVTMPFPERHISASQNRSAVSRSALEQRGPQATTFAMPGSVNRSRRCSSAAPFNIKKGTSSGSSQGRIVSSETPGGISSSYYPSVMPSIQPSPSRSKSLVNILSVRDLQSLELSPFEWHDNDSILKNFGAFAEDGSSYATADDGEADSKKSPPRTRHDSVKQDHNGQAGQTNTSNRHLPSTLSIEIRRENSEPDITASGSKLPAPNWNSRIRAERTGLPTIWRSGHASWDIQASLPKRISSKFWSQSRTASATIPETNTPGKLHGGSDHVIEQPALSRSSVAYNALQKVSQRNASAPPLSWARHQSRKQKQSATNEITKTRARYSSDCQDSGQPYRYPMAENRDVRSISFPAKMGGLVDNVLTKIMPSRRSSEKLDTSSQETKSIKHLPLEPLKINELQTSPALGEMEIFRPMQSTPNPPK
ncbi:uncharacterized protein BBA_03618 [Beauveria bassiana ARSEF 2860]|uniref:Uncharacterized protein n=1 Tax=Beauveria bassiana (strain ARSEF 2860) TaxID=655819 RepID=J5JSE2_BEAB2|nr:uncharacterized protein BBA_03618 [Beauveria bassiana ARSEF 2860]EJP67838.1 hypothetical protein BBA_03618 [Beauveria bassiana ARSEF 2860]